ncbi:MAG: pentapeptide repeat-containing protein [Candidatus Sulfotelmatobacter sp.]
MHTRAELDLILANHKQWIAKYSRYFTAGGVSDPKAFDDPLRADLSGADLIWADLRDADLSYADLSSARLTFADLTGASLYGAFLAHSEGPSCLVKADVRFVDFTGIDLSDANLAGARLYKGDLSGGVNLQDADLEGADLENVDLGGANLNFADLSSAILRNTEMDNVSVTSAKFWDTLFEPRGLPLTNTIARADGLRTIRWSQQSDLRNRSLPGIWESYLTWLSREDNAPRTFRQSLSYLWKQIREALKRPAEPHVPDKAVKNPTLYSLDSRVSSERTDRAGEENAYSIVDLRKALHDSGYRGAELEVNLAYQRCVQSSWQMVLLDWTCEWGANWQRPIVVTALLSVTCAFVYWYLIRFTRKNKLFVVGVRGERQAKYAIGNLYAQPHWLPSETELRGLKRIEKTRKVIHTIGQRLRWEARLANACVLFSAMSVLNLGVQGLDLGHWVRLLQKREFDLWAKGNIRRVAGIQSIASFVLLALAALSYFGHSFE